MRLVQSNVTATVREDNREKRVPQAQSLPLGSWCSTGLGAKLALMRVQLVDGTYELFRQFFGQPARQGDDGTEIAAIRGVVLSVVGMLADGATHIGVATDHVIESFRNDMWAGYKTGAEINPELWHQFPGLESALEALGVVVWPMVELEADDALASAAAVSAADPAVSQVVICTPDKDLAQCVVGDRIVQLDRRSGVVFNEDGVWSKFGVSPGSIPDWLALVGDSADGFPGLQGWGKRSAAVALSHYRSIASIPDYAVDWDPDVRRQIRGATKLAARLSSDRELAELFKDLATLRVDEALLPDVDTLRWQGPRPEFAEICQRLREPELAARVERLAAP
jgi:5'-3' exonuclease